MGNHIVKVKSINHITHDVLQIVTEMPYKYTLMTAQADDSSINKSFWKEEKRPFTFTYLPESNNLEFTIKTYPSQNGVTSELFSLKNDDMLVMHDVFGTIGYNSDGVFISGCKGITTFIGVLRKDQ